MYATLCNARSRTYNVYMGIFFSNGIKMTIVDRGLGSNHYLDGHPAQMNSIIDWKVKLGNKERFDKEQIGVKEPFPLTNCQFSS